MSAQSKRYSVVPGRAAYDNDLTRAELRVLNALGTYTDEHGWCYPQQSTLARDLGMSRTTVARAISRLRKLGYVESERRAERGRGLRGLWYRVILDTKSKPQDLVAVCSAEHTGNSREQSGKYDPACSGPHTGAGVLCTTIAVCSTQHTGYIAEGTQEKVYPHIPRKRGKAKRKRQETRKTKTPAEFEAAWAAWRKPGSSRAKALAAWRSHRASGERKLAAVQAYLESKQARAENGRFVPYLQRWLTDSLDSFLAVADKKRASMGASELALDRFPNWRAAMARIDATFGKAEVDSYWGRCIAISDEPIRLQAATKYAADRLRREQYPRVEKALGIVIEILDPPPASADKALMR